MILVGNYLDHHNRSKLYKIYQNGYQETTYKLHIHIKYYEQKTIWTDNMNIASVSALNYQLGQSNHIDSKSKLIGQISLC